MLGMALSLIVWLAPLQLVIGDMHGLNTLEHQPAKVAALEAHWETGSGVPLILFAWPDPEAETNHYEVAIPHLGSLILISRLHAVEVDHNIDPVTFNGRLELPSRNLSTTINFTGDHSTEPLGNEAILDRIPNGNSAAND